MKQAEFEKYAKEHNLFICTTNIIEQIKAEIEDLHSRFPHGYWTYEDLVELLDKYTKGESNG